MPFQFCFMKAEKDTFPKVNINIFAIIKISKPWFLMKSYLRASSQFYCCYKQLMSFYILIMHFHLEIWLPSLSYRCMTKCFTLLWRKMWLKRTFQLSYNKVIFQWNDFKFCLAKQLWPKIWKFHAISSVTSYHFFYSTSDWSITW